MAAGVLVMLLPTPANANHPVLVEGTCLGPGALQDTMVMPGTCGDHDGDARIGSAEDTDEPDRVFGTINAALGNVDLGATLNPTTAAQNGAVLIVEDGVFPEVVTITAANGNVSLSAAPGVEANVDAVSQGNAGSGGRQGAPGVIVDAPANRIVTLRNLISRNWTIGYDIRGASRVILDRVRAENNRDYGILVGGSARVAISDSHIASTGFRQAPNVDNAPQPGTGVEFEESSKGSIHDTTIAGSEAAGLSVDITKKQMKNRLPPLLS
jgi:hypothetical protein